MEFSNYKVWLFDGDGVLYSGENVLPGASELIQKLKQEGKKVALLTNNSTATLDQYLAKLEMLGIQVDKILTSAYVTLEIINASSAYIIGEQGIYDACIRKGVTVINGDEQKADAVVIGMDRKLTYDKLTYAINHILAGAQYVSTNPDKTFLVGSKVTAGSGAIGAAITACVEREPDLLVGKPEAGLFRLAKQYFGVKKEEIVMVGDRLETDILGAYNYGLDSILVKTGIASSYSKGQISKFANSYLNNSGPEIIDSLKKLSEKL